MTPRRYGPLPYLPITRRPKLTWPGGGFLETVGTLGGTWQSLPGAASGIELTITGNSAFYRVRF